MDTERLLDQLRILHNLDYDAVKGYEKIIDDIDDTMIKTQAENFKRDHERHTHDYEDLIGRLTDKAEEPHRDMKGIFLEAVAAIQSKFGERNTLKALENAEKLINSKYSEVLSEDFPPEVKMVVERNHADEKRHLEYVQQILQRKAA